MYSRWEYKLEIHTEKKTLIPLCYGVEIELIYTHFPERLPKIFGKAIVQYRIGNTQICVR